MVDSEFLELRIPLNEHTTKKIVALAALTGCNLLEIKDSLAADLIDGEAFDTFVSQKLHVALIELDGGDVDATEAVYRQASKKSFADVEQESNNVDDIAGHSLSGDEDTGAISLEEQVKFAPPSVVAPSKAPVDDLLVPHFEAPDADNNADAFLDSALLRPAQAPRGVQTPYGMASSAGSFNPKKPRARVAEYTGGEDANLF